MNKIINKICLLVYSFFLFSCVQQGAVEKEAQNLETQASQIDQASSSDLEEVEKTISSATVTQTSNSQAQARQASFSIPIFVKEPAGISRTEEMIQNGIPIPKSYNILDVSLLKITDEDGVEIPSQFTVLSRWKGGKNDTTKAIQWLFVNFKDPISQNETKKYFLTEKFQASTSSSMITTNDSNKIVINTGVSEFTISKSKFSVFEKITILETGKDIVNSTDGYSKLFVNYSDNSNLMEMTAQAPEEVKVEYDGDLFTKVKLTGVYDNAPTRGNVALRYVARYTFYKGSGHFNIDYNYSWPGTINGGNSFELGWGTVSQLKEKTLLIEKAILKLPISLSSPYQGHVSATNSDAFTGQFSNSDELLIYQKRRTLMSDPPQFDLKLGTNISNGAMAEKPFVGVGDASGALGVTIQNMKVYEPQSIQANFNEILLNITAEDQWLGPFMGTFTKIGMSVFNDYNNFATKKDELIASTNQGIFAWPDLKIVSESNCFEELWDNSASTTADNFINILTNISDSTYNDFITLGMHGFMTFGLSPRLFDGVGGWDNEFGGNQSTITHDHFLFQATFTDYHNAFSNVSRLFAATGDTEFLYKLSFPAARRTLHTQIIQPDPHSPISYSGWAPIGYGGYRKDFNSSHSYFDNLFFYYYLTGDKQVIDTVSYAGRTIKNWYTRQNGLLVDPTLPTPVSFVFPMGRVGSQMNEIFYFLGHASEDSSFLDDNFNNFERVVTRHIALLKKDGKEYAFITKDNLYLQSSGTFQTEQFWMALNYSIGYMWKLYLEYGDIPIGKNKILLSRLYKAFHNTLWDYVSTVRSAGDGTISGSWSNTVYVDYSGGSYEGNLLDVRPQTTGEAYIYTDNKPSIAALSFRAAKINGNDQEMISKGKETFDHIFKNFNLTRRRWEKRTALIFKTAHASLFHYVESEKTK